MPNNCRPLYGPAPSCACGCGESVVQYGAKWNTWVKGHSRRKHCDPASFDPKLAKRNEYILRTYGITQAEFDALKLMQNNTCALCGGVEPGKARNEKQREWCVDHNHVTGAIRGLLCMQCNAGIGNLKDSPDLLRKAACYVENNQ
jgi:hypothetical protein